MAVLFPGPRRFIVTALFAEPERWWSANELADRAGMSAKSLRPHIARLSGCGLISEKQEQGRAFFQPDRRSPIFPDLSSLVTKLTNDSGGATILVVEDQAATAQITRILLESWGYRVLEAHSGQEAIGLFDGDPNVHLVLSDIHMPVMSGTELAAELRRRRQNVRIVLMSGDYGLDLLPRGCAFLPKPFNPAGLARIVRKELDRAMPRINAP